MRMIISGVVMVVGIGMVFYFSTKEDASNGISLSTTNTEARLVVSAQNATSAVKVDSVTLPKEGFLAVRSVDNGRLGQIIEISRYLSIGTHANIDIPLGDFYEGGEELIVMAYEDAGDDKVFNDFDQPLKIGGVPLSVYVATGSQVPPSITSDTGNTDVIHTMGNSTMATIRYTNEGYVPANITVKTGTMVMFVNESDQDMWVASNGHPAHMDLPTFDQFELSPKGSQYVYTFDQVGSWKYHDHIAPVYGGVITVIE